MEATGPADRRAWRQDSVCRANSAPMVEAVLQSTSAGGSIAKHGLEMGIKAQRNEPGPISRCTND